MSLCCEHKLYISNYDMKIKKSKDHFRSFSSIRWQGESSCIFLWLLLVDLI